MKVIYFDLIGGASGDMILAALIDAGMPAKKLEEMLDGLKLDEFEIILRFKLQHLMRVETLRVITLREKLEYSQKMRLIPSIPHFGKNTVDLECGVSLQI